MSCMPSPTTWAVLPLDTTRPWSSTMPQISGISAMTLGMHGFSYGIVSVLESTMSILRMLSC